STTCQSVWPSFASRRTWSQPSSTQTTYRPSGPQRRPGMAADVFQPSRTATRSSAPRVGRAHSNRTATLNARWTGIRMVDFLGGAAVGRGILGLSMAGWSVTTARFDPTDLSDGRSGLKAGVLSGATGPATRLRRNSFIGRMLGATPPAFRYNRSDYFQR